MKFSIGSFGSKKGITPVIATVLLLGITVAIGLTVYTQAQGMISGGADTGKLKKAQDTELQLTPVFSKSTGSGGKEIKVRITNTGDRAVNISKFSMMFGPPNFPNPVSYAALPSGWKVGGGNKCADLTTVLSKGDYEECATGVKFPDTLEKVEIQISADNFKYKESTTCKVTQADAKSC
ncbi:MAG: archaellin/type IV pilin N-terminal domain-containing protein [Candidatus Nanohalobium sp.]